MNNSLIQPVQVLGKNIYPFASKEQLLNFIDDKSCLLIAIGIEKMFKKDTELTKIINNNIAYCDGVGAVYALKRKGFKAVKIPGSLLWLDIVKKYYQTKKIALIGSTDEIIEKTGLRLRSEFPGISLVIEHNGFLSEEDINKIETELCNLKPDIVFVAMGSPKQEILMKRYLSLHKALYMGLGGSFDLYSGKTKPVPEWWKKIFKWEGLYRSFTEFKNINRWIRQLAFFKFIFYVISGKI